MKEQFFGIFFSPLPVSFLSKNTGNVIEQEERRNGGRRNPQQDSTKVRESYCAPAFLNSSVPPFLLFNSASWSDTIFSSWLFVSFVSKNAGDVIEQEKRRNGGRRNPQQNPQIVRETDHAPAFLNSSVPPFLLFNSASWSDTVGANTGGNVW